MLPKPYTILVYLVLSILSVSATAKKPVSKHRSSRRQSPTAYPTPSNTISTVPTSSIIKTTPPPSSSTVATPSSTRTFTLAVQSWTASPDGYQTNVYGVNGVMEYPIIVNRGDHVEVNVKNQMSIPTSMHWHGLFQNGTNWYDGAAGVTQCPILPSTRFTYRFDTSRQHGTYWYHAHYKSQYVKGIHGPLIIRDPDNEPYTNKYDEEMIVMLTDWFHAKTSDELLVPFMESSDGFEPLPDSGLINGKGRYDCTLVKDGTPCDPNAPLEVFNFTPGKRYRLRIINAAAQATFMVSVDGHAMQVIEADGVDTQIMQVDTVRISPGQRYSVIITANADSTQNYWLRSVIDTMSYTQYTPGVFNETVLGIVSYTGTNTDPTSTPKPSPVILDPFKLLPYQQTSLGIPTISYGMSFAIVPDDTNKSRAFVTVDGQFDWSVYDPPALVPTLLQVHIGKNMTGTSVNPVYVNKNDVIDLVVYNDDPMDHPFHLHGHTFQVVNYGLMLNAPVRPGSFPSNQQVYPERDTIPVPPCRLKSGGSGEGACGGTKGYVHLRFRADNPGVWLFHCHIEWHMMQGLGFTFIIGKDVVEGWNVPSGVKSQCDSFIRKSGGVGGGKRRSAMSVGGLHRVMMRDQV